MNDWEKTIDRRIESPQGRRSTDCVVCNDPGGFAVRVEHSEQKIKLNCDEIRKVKHRINNIDVSLEQINYLKDELAEFKIDRREFTTAVSEIKEFIKSGYVPIERYKWVERIAMILTAAGIVAAINVFKIS